MAARARAVATTVGPYQRYGFPLVQACAEAGTHYADLTGEVLFMRETIDRFDATARESGARIVHTCGFDSIPSDLGVLALHRAAQRDGAGELEDTTFVLERVSGGLSGGTLDSLRGQLDEMRARPGAAQASPATRTRSAPTARPSPTSARSATCSPSSATPSSAGWRRS